MSDGTEQTTAEDRFVAAFQSACSDLIASARRLKPRMVALDMEAAREFGDIAGRRMAEAGATEDECAHYSARILAMVLAEPQA